MSFLVFWRPDRSEGSHRDAEHALGAMLSSAPLAPRSSEWIWRMACAARLCGDLHEAETGRYAGSVSPIGIVLRSAP